MVINPVSSRRAASAGSQVIRERRQKETLAVWIRRLNLKAPEKISEALGSDKRVQLVLRSLADPAAQGTNPLFALRAPLQFGALLRPVVERMSVPDASKALGFLDKPPVAAIDKGWIIRSAFRDQEKGRAVAIAFVERYNYSDQATRGGDFWEGLSVRMQLLSAFELNPKESILRDLLLIHSDIA
jgi:hypothetical protein